MIQNKKKLLFFLLVASVIFSFFTFSYIYYLSQQEPKTTAFSYQIQIFLNDELVYNAPAHSPTYNFAVLMSQWLGSYNYNTLKNKYFTDVACSTFLIPYPVWKSNQGGYQLFIGWQNQTSYADYYYTGYGVCFNWNNVAPLVKMAYKSYSYTYPQLTMSFVVINKPSTVFKFNTISLVATIKDQNNNLRTIALTFDKLSTDISWDPSTQALKINYIITIST
jgi:hypothetical protein